MENIKVALEEKIVIDYLNSKGKDGNKININDLMSELGDKLKKTEFYEKILKRDGNVSLKEFIKVIIYSISFKLDKSNNDYTIYYKDDFVYFIEKEKLIHILSERIKESQIMLYSQLARLKFLLSKDKKETKSDEIDERLIELLHSKFKDEDSEEECQA